MEKQQKLSDWLYEYEQGIENFWWEGLSPNDCEKFLTEVISTHNLTDNRNEENIFDLMTIRRMMKL